MIDSNVHDQVEFAIFRGGSVISHSTFQPPNNNNSQNIRLATFTYLGQNFEVLAYGDGSETHIVEFDNLGNQVAAITDLTPQLFSQLTSLGDGRIGLIYNENIDALGTSQMHMDVFDLRTTGLTVADTGIANGQNVDFAGTRFNDVVQGSNTNNIDNTYYYVGANTTGGGPTDVFHGGTGAGSWNTAILPDGRVNYSVVSTIATVITNTDSQHLHAGTLTVDHVQALAFNPTHDPVPASDGSLQATGDTLLLLSPFASEVTFDSNATLELAQPSTFTGHAVNFAPGNFIDLDGFSLSSTSIFYSGTSEGGTLTVTDATHSGATAANIALSGSYTTATFTKASDGHGGVDIGMTNADFAAPDNVIASATILQGSPGSVLIASNLLLANDTDSNSAQLTLQSVDPSDLPQQTHGTVALQSGNVLYTAPVGFVPPLSGQQVSDSFDYTLVDANLAQSTGHVNLTVVGGNQIVGTQENDLMVSSTASETFTGLGGVDTFVFRPAFGHDTITDFHPGQDVIDFDHTLFADISTILSHATAVGANTVITLDASDTVTLLNVAPVQLHASDFHLI